MNFLKRSLLITASLGVVASANAWTVGNAPDLSQFGAGYYADAPVNGSTFYNQRIADNFALGASAGYVLNSVTWWGGSEGAFFPDLTNMSGFEIEIFDGSNTSVFSTVVGTGSLSVTDLGLGGFGANVYQLTLSGLNANIGTGGNYLISVGGVYVAPQNDAFVWHWAVPGDSQIFANADLSDTFTSFPGNPDVAFELNGTVVPEPASMAVLGLGVAAMIRRRRNK